MSDIAIALDPGFDEAAEPVGTTLEPVPPFPRILQSLFGLVLLGAVTGLGTGDAGMAGRSIPSALAIGGGAVLLTGPALLVAHQFLGLKGRPEDLVAALVRSFCRLGDLSLGMVPLVGLFTITSRLGPGIMALGFATAGLFSLIRLIGELMVVERDTPEEGRLAREGTMALLTFTWAGLFVAIVARLALGVLFFVVP